MSDTTNQNDITMTVKICGYTLCYKLTGDTVFSPPSYSFFVSVENEDGSYYDEALVRNVTSSKTEAHEILHRLSAGTVTPMTLREILEDILA